MAETELGPKGTRSGGRKLFQASQGQGVIHQQVQLQVDSLSLIKVHLGAGREWRNPGLCWPRIPISHFLRDPDILSSPNPKLPHPTFSLSPPSKPNPSPSVPALPMEPGEAYLTVQVVEPSPRDYKSPALAVIAQWVGAVDFGLLPATHRPVYT